MRRTLEELLEDLINSDEKVGIRDCFVRVDTIVNNDISITIFPTGRWAPLDSLLLSYYVVPRHSKLVGVSSPVTGLVIDKKGTHIIPL